MLELARLLLEEEIQGTRSRVGLGFRSLGLCNLEMEDMAVRDMVDKID